MPMSFCRKCEREFGGHELYVVSFNPYGGRDRYVKGLVCSLRGKCGSVGSLE